MTEDTVAAMASLCDVFQRTVAARPEAVALRPWDGGLALTWRDYGDRVRQLAAGLHQLGVRRGDTVALMLTNRPEFHLIDAAALHLGATVFSIYNTFTCKQIGDLFASAGNRVVIGEQAFMEQVQSARAVTPVDFVVCVDGPAGGAITLEDLATLGDPAFDFERAWRAVDRYDVAALIYTSGTTGDPKGVELTHANLLFAVNTRVALQKEVMGTVAHERVISYLPDANLANRFAAHYTPMATGAEVIDVRDGAAMLSAFRAIHPTTFMGVPMIWYKLKALIDNQIAENPSGFEDALAVGAERARLLRAGQPIPAELAARFAMLDASALRRLRVEFGLDQLAYATSGGAPIAPETLEFFHALGVPVCEVYGLTETAASGVGNHPNHIRIGTVGQARPGVEIRLAGDGELLLRSPGVMRGYRNDPAKTAETIESGGWLRTGDIAAIDADGYVRIIDRKKDLIINSSGKNLAPANIENAIKLGCPLLGSVVAVGDGRPHVVALLTLDREQASAFARKHRIADRSAAALAADPRVLDAVAEGVARGNARLSRVEQVRAYSLLPTYWDATSEELTATTKVRRRIVHDKYASTIDNLYVRT